MERAVGSRNARTTAAALAAAVVVCAAAPATARDDTVAVNAGTVGVIFGRHAAFVGHPEGLVLTYRLKRGTPKAPAPKATPTPAPDEPTFPDQR
jgi:hypothetical protein